MPRFMETIFFLPEPPFPVPVRLYSAGITHPDPAYNIRRQNGDDYYVLEYIVSGKGHLSAGDQEFSPSAGDVYLLHPGIPNEYSADRNDPWEKRWFNIGGPLLSHLVEAYRLSGEVYFPQCPLEKMFRDTLEIVRRGGPEAIPELALKIHRILAELSAWNQRHPETMKSAEGMMMKEYLDSHIRHPVVVEDLARRIGKSRAQTLRIFQKDWNTTPCRYLQEQRLRIARQYLENTGHSVASVAALVGFRDEFYFSNWFKEKTGEAPFFFKQRFRQKKTE